MLEVRRYTGEHSDEWNRFVAASKNGTFLFDRNYMDYHADRFSDHSLMIYRNGSVYALLPANVKDDTLYLDDLIRSAEASHGDLMIRQLDILCPKFGFEFEMRDRYYGWAYSKDSGLREILRNVLKEKGVELKESATHGGLECGIFKGLIPDLDIITYAPISSGAHTVSEMLDLESFDRTYENLCKVLENCR